jgi:hypothetical protein
MKILFAGPSLYGVTPDLDGIELRPPAACGDILVAVEQGANVIGLIDGNFEAMASVWHKEILHALHLGVTVLGASSMGALRAAECAAFGMLPVGVIANAYTDGSLDDDAAVALQHGPAELGYPPLSIPQVDALATIDRLAAAGEVTADVAEMLRARSAALHFKDRVAATICAGTDLAALFEARFFSQKQADALELIGLMRGLSDSRGAEPGWTFVPSPFWGALRSRLGV